MCPSSVQKRALAVYTKVHQVISGNQLCSISSRLSATVLMGNIFIRQKTSRLPSEEFDRIGVMVRGYPRLKCHVVSLDNKPHSQMTFPYITELLKYAQCGNPPKYERFIWKMSHARPCMLLWWRMQCFPCESQEFLNPKPKIKLLPSHANNDTQAGCWQLTAADNKEAVRQEICSWWF